ncbi:MAG: AraC family transcriptional regulator, partial [Angelakisella sp.]
FRDAPQKFGGITLYQFGELYCDSGWEIPPHQQWCHEITYIISGNATFLVNGIKTKVKEGDVCISPFESEHGIQVDAACDLRYVYMAFLFNEDANTEEFELLKGFFKNGMTNFYAHNNTNVLPPLLRGMEEFYRKSAGYRMMVEGYLKQILILTYRSFDEHNIGIPKQRHIFNSSGTTLYAVIHYVEDNIFELTSIEEISKSLNYNHAYIARLFKKHMGMTLQEYLEHKKVEKALDLLGHGKVPLGQVVAQLGFGSQENFTRVFNRVTKMPLEEFLQQEQA